MTDTHSPFRLEELRERLRPFRLHWYPQLGSTNGRAAELRKSGELFAPAVVLTGEQTAGRGRGAHAWWSGPGCITVTFVLPVDERVMPHQIPLAAGLAVRNACAQFSGNDGVQLKWPNDVLYGGRKLAGLLCERLQNADLVGLGLNVNLDPADAPADLRARVTSLSQVGGRALDLTDTLAAVGSHLHRVIGSLAERPFGLLLKEYDACHALIGREVRVFDASDAAGVSGRCEGLDEMGRLLLRSRGRVHRVISGQVQIL